MSETPPRPTYLADYRPPPFVVDDIELDFELGEETTTVRTAMKIEPAGANGAVEPLRLDGRDLELVSIRLQGQRLTPNDYTVEAERLILPPRLLAPFRPPYRIDIENRIHPVGNTTLEGLYRSGKILCTQCEAEGFRKITYGLDRPDVMARFRTRLVADRHRYPVLLSNGNLITAEELPGNRHGVLWEDPFRKPSYLFALVAGDLAHLEDTYVTISGRTVTLRFYAESHQIGRCRHALQALKKAMRWDEQRYGREYDLDRYMVVAVDDFNMGAMENKGLNIFNSKYILADPETATDDDFEAIEAVIAHEYCHNWTGNRVTCRDWFQLSLKEGLTVFREQQFAAEMGSASVKRIAEVRFLRHHQFPEDAGPLAHPVRPRSYIEMNNFYTTTVYNKGAEIVRMYHTLLGAQGFRRGMDLYFQRHDGQAVTTDDFARAMADANGADLHQFLRWYDQAGTPLVHFRGDHDAKRATFALELEQTCPHAPGQEASRPFHIPVAMGLLDPQGQEIPLQLEGETGPAGTTRVLELRAERQVFRFVHVAHAPIPSLLRGFSAPVKLAGEFRDAHLAFLMAHDTDAFTRWDAAQQLWVRQLLAMVSAWCDGQTMAVRAEVLDAMALALRDPRDPALVAQIITLPDEQYVGDNMAVIDVEAIHAAHTRMQAMLAERLETELVDAYQANGSHERYRFEPAAVARRRLKNRCLAYLTTLEGDGHHQRAMAQFQYADNMTDTIAALRALSDCDCPARLEALRTFYERWSETPLVLDKWFALQATSRLPGTLRTVQRLMEHPRFSLANPNRVRALIGAFCSNNFAQFHAATGEGYRFLADQVIRLNQSNPQVAARLLTPLTRWQRFDRSRQALMKGQLERIAEGPQLSPDVYEMVQRSIA